MLNLLKNNIAKDNELKKKQGGAETRIKEINREIQKIKNEITELEKTTNAEKEKVEKLVFNILKKEMKDLSYTNNGDLINFPDLLKALYDMAESDTKRVKGNVIQKRYRERKSGKKV
jgi:archaellum component FlaC